MPTATAASEKRSVSTVAAVESDKETRRRWRSSNPSLFSISCPSCLHLILFHGWTGFFLSFALSNPETYLHGQSLTRSGRFPTLLKCIVRNIDNHMVDWKVIALINGEIEVVSGLAAQGRPGAHEWTVWQGTAADKAEALQSAEKADPRVDLEWMRIRYERDLDIR